MNLKRIENTQRRKRSDLPHTFDLAHFHLDAFASAFERRPTLDPTIVRFLTSNREPAWHLKRGTRAGYAAMPLVDR